MSVGVNTATAFPSTFLTVNLPTTFPFGSFASTSSAGCPFSPNTLYDVGSIAAVFSVPLTSALPGTNVTSLDCSTPCTSVDVAGSAVGATPTICGV